MSPSPKAQVFAGPVATKRNSKVLGGGGEGGGKGGHFTMLPPTLFLSLSLLRLHFNIGVSPIHVEIM